MVGGLGLLAAALLGSHPALSTEGTTGFVVLSLMTAGLFALVLVALIGVHARYGDAYGQLGRVVVGLFGLATAGVVISLVADVVAPQSTILFGLGDVTFFAMFPLATAIGIVLWRRTAASRVTAGLLVAVLPVLVGVFALISLSPVAEDAAFIALILVFTLGITALGYDLWTPRDTTAAAASPSTGGM